MIESIARDTAEVAPGAWILNYTNPATAVAHVLRDVPGVRFVSLCSCTGYPTNPEWLAEQAGVAADELMTPVPVAGLEPLRRRHRAACCAMEPTRCRSCAPDAGRGRPLGARQLRRAALLLGALGRVLPADAAAGRPLRRPARRGSR